MIATHNTFTYLKAKNKIMNVCPKLWRCQDKTIEEQYELGARYFDIRVFRNNCYWQVCHGKAEFDVCFKTLDEACKYFEENFNEASIRIMLEKGDIIDVELFKKEVEEAKENKNFAWGVIKSPWETIYYRKEFHPLIKDYSYEDWNGKTVIKSVFGKNLIKDNAKKNNPKITEELIEDKEYLYFMDYPF